ASAYPLDRCLCRSPVWFYCDRRRGQVSARLNLWSNAVTQAGNPATDNPVEYIQHHLTNLSVGEGFWTLHLDTLFFGWVMAGLLIFVSWRVGRRLNPDNPRGTQNVLEAVLEFVDDQVKSTFPGHNP